MIIAHSVSSFPFCFAYALLFMVNSVPLLLVQPRANTPIVLQEVMGSCPPGQPGCQQSLPSWVLSASLNTQSCGQAALMAADYCFLKFVCVHSHLKSIFHICPWVPQPIALNHQSGFPQLSILLVQFPLDCREESNNCAVSSFPFFVSW